MATYGQLAMAGQASNDRVAFETAQNKETDRRTKANKWGGWGRTLGLLGTGLGIAAMSNPLTGIPAAIAIGLGGLAGRSAGRAAGGGRERDADKNIDAQFYQGKQREFAKEIGTYQEGVRERMLVDTGKDALSAFMYAKYAKPGMEKMKGKYLGRFGSPDQKLGLMTGDPNARSMIDAAKAQSQSIASLDGMHGEAMFSKADPSTWASQASRAVDPAQLGTNPLGVSSGSDVLSSLPVPYSPTAPAASTYGAAVDRGSAMSDAGYLNDTIRQSLRLPSSVQDQMGGMNYQQWTGQSDQALEEFLMQGQGQQGSLFDMISHHTPQPRGVRY